MGRENIISVFAALGQETRMQILRELVKAENESLSVNEISERLDILQNSASTHLAILARAGLVQPTRVGRQRIYSLARTRIADVIETLRRDFAS